MKYIFYKIGVNDSNLNISNLEESFGMKTINNLPERLKKQMIELLRLMADYIEKKL